MAISEHQEQWISEQSFQQVIRQYRGAILPSTHPAVRHAERIARRIISALDSGLVSNDTKWRIFVIDSPTANAFVLPSGDIFVFTGIFPMAQTEAGLAAILGHEIAHKIARHGAEKMSFYQFFSLASTLLQIFVTGELSSPLSGILQNLFLFLPFSRKCEREADRMGLMLMAKACYDPREAIGLWERMQKMSGGKEVSAFMSTHPSHYDRIESIKEWLEEADRIYEAAGCHEQRGFFR